MKNSVRKSIHIRIVRSELRGIAFRNDAVTLRPVSLLTSVILHSFLIVFLARAAGAPVDRMAATYEVSLVSPEKVHAPEPVVEQPQASVLNPNETVSAQPARTNVMLREASIEPEKNQAEDFPYWVGVRNRIARRLHYPYEVLEGKGRAETIVVRLQISSEGHLLQADVVSSDADAVLVQTVLRAVHGSEPFPAPSERVDRNVPLIVLLPIRFVAS